MDLPTLPNIMFELNSIQGWVSFLLTAFLPFLIALLTKPSVPGWAKGVGLYALSAVKAVGEAFVLGGADFDLQKVAITAGVNFAIAVLAYFGILRTTATMAKAQNTLVK